MKRFVPTAAVLAFVAAASLPIFAVDWPFPSAAPSTQPRDEQTIITDLRATNEQLAAVMPALPSIADADFRKQNGAKIVPLVCRLTDLFLELRGSQSDQATAKKIDDDRSLYLAVLVALDDSAAVAELTPQASPTATDASHVVSASSALALGNWWRNSKDAAAQGKVLDDYSVIAKAHPTEDRLAITLASMANLGAANDALAKRALDIVRTTLTCADAKQVIAAADAVSATKEMLNKPLVVNGRTTANLAFSSADMKGKVILVDCWATWCGPCNAEIPRVKELYAANHAKGLEIVGVDCDDSDTTVNAFTKDHEMPWLQLRELSQTQDPWHPLAKQWHVDGIPTMFLIDKKGILRYIDAREDTATKIAQLLAEAP